MILCLNVFDLYFSGIRIYSKVYAINAVGLQSETVVSDGIVIDATPPVPEAFVQFGANLIINPSFEVDSADAVVDLTDSAAIQAKCAANFSPASWNILNNTCSVAIKPLANVAQDGKNMLLLFGTIEQTVSNLQIGSRFRIQFYASHHAASHYPTLSNEVVLQIGAERHVLLLFPRVSRIDQSLDDWIPWQKHVYYFTAKKNSVSIKLGTASNRGGILLDNVSVESYDTAPASTDLVSIHSARIQDWSSIHASWNFVDVDSPIVNYQWAIGKCSGSSIFREIFSTAVK